MIQKPLATCAPAQRLVIGEDIVVCGGGHSACTRYCFRTQPDRGSQSSFYWPPHLQSIPYCNTIARLLRNTRPPTDPSFECHTPYNIGDGNIVWRSSGHALGDLRLGPPTYIIYMHIHIHVCIYIYIYYICIHIYTYVYIYIYIYIYIYMRTCPAPGSLRRHSHQYMVYTYIYSSPRYLYTYMYL